MNKSSNQVFVLTMTSHIGLKNKPIIECCVFPPQVSNSGFADIASLILCGRLLFFKTISTNQTLMP